MGLKGQVMGLGVQLRGLGLAEAYVRPAERSGGLWGKRKRVNMDR